jgi:hypothetical protein
MLLRHDITGDCSATAGIKVGKKTWGVIYDPLFIIER